MPYQTEQPGADGQTGLNWLTHPPGLRTLAALLETTCGETLRQPRSQFGLAGLCLETEGGSVAVQEELVLDAPFGRLLRFRAGRPDAPPLLLVAPMSGHSAAQLRDTVLGLLPDYQVHITDWADAREVPLSAGGFGLDDYIDYLLRFMRAIGPGAHLIAICQSCVPALAAAALLAQENDPAQARSLTLMAGPIDARINPSPVNRFATGAPLDWFEEELISLVPAPLPGAGRRVYGGAMQLVASIGMEQRRRLASVAVGMADPLTFWRAMLELGSAMPRQQPVLDLAAEFYLDNLHEVFQRCALARGMLRHRGRTVQPQCIRQGTLLTVEAALDEICGAGQTRAAHGLCAGLPAAARQHVEIAGASHRDVFSGPHWREQVLPELRRMLDSQAEAGARRASGASRASV
jgi:poly(3-hydroxybutyrate) depolymerase